jgi:putative addiction module killer protein
LTGWDGIHSNDCLKSSSTIRRPGWPLTLDRLERGNLSVAKGIGAGLCELRLDFGPGYRIYFGKDGKRFVILLGGGAKKRQQANIDTACAPWQEYKKRKGEK